MDLLVTSVTHSQGKHSWLGSAHGVDNGETITLDLTAFVKATHFPNGFIPSGMMLGEITAQPGVYAPYLGADTIPGQGLAKGHLLGDVEVPVFGATNGVGDALGSLFTHGTVVEANLPSGSGVDAAGKADCARIRYT